MLIPVICTEYWLTTLDVTVLTLDNFTHLTRNQQSWRRTAKEDKPVRQTWRQKRNSRRRDEVNRKRTSEFPKCRTLRSGFRFYFRFWSCSFWFIKVWLAFFWSQLKIWLCLLVLFVGQTSFGLGALVKVPLEHFPFLLVRDLRSKLLHSWLLPRSVPLLSLTNINSLSYLTLCLFLLFHNVCIASSCPRRALAFWPLFYFWIWVPTSDSSPSGAPQVLLSWQWLSIRQWLYDSDYLSDNDAHPSSHSSSIHYYHYY